MAVSRTRMMELVKAWDAPAVDTALTESPALKAWRDERGRSWMHVACGVQLKPERSVEASLATVDVLLRHGLSLDDPAFTEGDWRATPVWFSVSRGENRRLTEHLLTLGANPNYSLWAAGFRDDLETLDLLIAHGADVNDPSVAFEPPFLGAVMTSHFLAAEALLKHGADVNAQDAQGRTALHLMLKKGSDKAHFPMLIAHGARGDLADHTGVTPRQIMRRKQDPDFRRMAEELA